MDNDLEKCKSCGKPFRFNKLFYRFVHDKLGRTWQSLNPEEKGKITTELNNRSIFSKLNPDGSAHICGQANKSIKNFEERLDSIVKETEKKLNDMSNKLNSAIRRIINFESRISELENNLSDRIRFAIKQILKDR